MLHSRLVVIWGTSLLLSLVADQLGERPELAVMRLNPRQADAFDRVQAEQPAVLIAELTPDRAAEVDRVLLELMTACQHTPVIRLDVTAGRATILHSHQIEVERFADLIHVIEKLTMDDSPATASEF